MWLSNIPPLDSDGWAIPWKDFEVSITKPNETTETLGPFQSDPVGSQWVSYSPNMVGKYTFKMIYSGQTIGDNVYLASTSQTVEIIVQEDPIQLIPNNPLPTDYWQRPINAENREWWSISGNWLQNAYNTTFRSTGGFFGDGGAFNPYTKAPNTAHIVWTKPIALGGIVGGKFGNINYYTGLTYEGKWAPPIIMNGRLYYNTPLGSSAFQGFECVDLRTGETLWWQNTSIFRNGGPLTLGQLYNYDSPNQHGVIPYLWSCHTNPWIMYDAFTGREILRLENASYGQFVMSPTGDLLVYLLNGRNNWLAMWNSSSIPEMLGSQSGTLAWQWRPPAGKTLDWKKGIQWNVTVPDVPGTQSINRITDVILASTASWRGPATWVDVAYDMNTGEQLWVANKTTLPGGIPLIYGGNFPRPVGEGVYVMYAKETLTWYGFDADNGEMLWSTDPATNAWATYPAGGVIAYGKLMTASYDGMVHCHDITTGENLWNYFGGTAGFETPYGHYPFFGGVTVADRKIFAATNEHSPSTPLWKGEKLHAIDTETGDSVWTISGLWYGPGGGRGAGMGPVVIADGYLVSANGYDNQLYCFGKGTTETTVTAAPKVSGWGSSVLVEGTVTDQSPGAEGTPAIADEYMTEWMEYLYMQKPFPKDVEGVEVVLETLDPNNNFYEIGRATSDASGFYSLMWEPPVPGKYTIIATFEGSESYWRSYTETAIGVVDAPSPAQPIEPEPVAPASAQPEPTTPAPAEPEPATPEPTEYNPIGATETTMITNEAAIITSVAVACVIGIVAIWALRKRK
jgi:hypothetical protein